MTHPAKILLVDDDWFSCQVQRDGLLLDGLEVDVCRSGEEALVQLGESTYDLLITDLLMPGIDGRTLLLEARRIQPGLEVIVLTAVDSVATAVDALRAGAWHYLVKPVHPDVVRHEVARCLDRRRLEGACDALRRHVALHEAARRLLSGRELSSLPGDALSVIAWVAGAAAGVLVGVEPGDGVEPSGPEASARPPRLLAHRGLTAAQADRLAMAVLGHAPTLLGDDPVRVLAPGALPSVAHHAQQVLVAPLVDEGKALGVVALLRPASAPAFADRCVSDVAFLARAAGRALGNAHRLTSLAAQLDHDPLTGLLEARAFERALAERCAAAAAGPAGDGRNFSVIFIDLDRFKAINDRHGHQVGSDVLREAARVLRRHLSENDLLARYGGDEFMALLPGAAGDEALVVAERLRRVLAAHRFHVGEGRTARLTLCGGVASCPEDGRAPNELLRLADAAMFHGKRRGRDAVSRASALPQGYSDRKRFGA